VQHSLKKSDSDFEYPPKTREQVLEVSVFLFLIVPSMALSFFAFKQGNIGFTLTAFATILRDLALVSLILFFLWRNREPVKNIGWNLRNFEIEIAVGVVLFIPLFYVAGLLDAALVQTGFSSPKTPLPSLEAAGGIGATILGIVLVAVVAFAEEVIFRGYLLLRFDAITSNPTVAVILSTLIFTLGHGYEGTAGIVTVGFLGLVFALTYRWRKSLIAPIMMHFLQDFIGIVLAPLAGSGR
jgi:membrane protease YdiL (CAAX protease family)